MFFGTMPTKMFTQHPKTYNTSIIETNDTNCNILCHYAWVFSLDISMGETGLGANPSIYMDMNQAHNTYEPSEVKQQ
jgi:hypothetical protein